MTLTRAVFITRRSSRESPHPLKRAIFPRFSDARFFFSTDVFSTSSLATFLRLLSQRFPAKSNVFVLISDDVDLIFVSDV